MYNSLCLLFIMDPPEKLDPDKDTTLALMRAALERNIQACWCEISDLTVDMGVPRAYVKYADFSKDGELITKISVDIKKLDSFDLIFMRKDPPFNEDYLYSTYILDLCKKAKVINAPKGLRAANEKLFIFKFPMLIPPTILTKRTKDLKRFLKDSGGLMVVKPIYGSGGEKVFLVREDDENKNVILETITEYEKVFAMGQVYIHNIKEGDKRILLWNGSPIGQVLRIPPPGELRGNLHVGASFVSTPLTKRDLEICETLKPALLSLGLYFVGIDVIGDYLTEVNVTSPTGVMEINALKDIKLEMDILDYALGII